MMNAKDKTENSRPSETTETYELTATDRLVICYALGRLHVSPFREHAMEVAKKFGVKFAEDHPSI